MTAGIASFFLKHCDVSELSSRGESCVGGRHPARNVAVGGASEMLTHLRLHVIVEGAAEEHGTQAQGGLAKGVEGIRHDH